MLPSEQSAFLRPLSFSSTAVGTVFPIRPCALRFESSRYGLAGSKTANGLASTTCGIRLPAAFFLNGAVARPDKKIASTGYLTISVTNVCRTLIGIFQPLQNSLPLRQRDSSLRLENPPLDEYPRTVRGVGSGLLLRLSHQTARLEPANSEYLSRYVPPPIELSTTGLRKAT